MGVCLSPLAAIRSDGLATICRRVPLISEASAEYVGSINVPRSCRWALRRSEKFEMSDYREMGRGNTLVVFIGACTLVQH